MLSKALNPKTTEHRLMRWLLVLALLFSAAHLALHDLEVSGGLNEEGECQACRLGQSPAATFASPSVSAPLRLVAYVLPVTDAVFQPSHTFHFQWTRAPPLF